MLVAVTIVSASAPGARDRWLDPTAGGTEPCEFPLPLVSEDLEAYEISTLVNSPRNDSPECVRPIA
jgi:putative SOS response-associated peptidase YedK